MAGWNRPKVTERLPPNQRAWFISDLHLGDGTPSDIFFGKDRHLMALIDTVEREDAVLVVVGDAMDFHQAWSFTRILRAHADLLSAMSRLSRHGRLIYVVGNHDWDINLYRDLLHFKVCDELLFGDKIIVTHGYEYDPYIGKDLDGSHIATKVHHLVERYLNTWIRVPLGEFYTMANRLSFWLTHKIAVSTWLWAKAWEAVGVPGVAKSRFEHLHYWCRTQMGDPMCMFGPIRERLHKDRFQFVVAGHSHLPGIIRFGDRAYVNTGSWTFGSSQYVIWDGEDFHSFDWLSGREFRDELYQPVLRGEIDEKDFWRWWDENYMGWLRFREGEERRGRLRGWEVYIRDHQYLAMLAPPGYDALASSPQVPVVHAADEEDSAEITVPPLGPPEVIEDVARSQG